MDLTQFNPDDHVDASGGGGAVPPGWYGAKIARFEWKDTRKGDGVFLELEWLILGVHENEAKDSANSHQGRRVWLRLNLKNPSDVAVGIAEKDLAKTMNAIGVKRLVNGPADLLEKPCLIRLKYLPENADWDARNEIHGFKKLIETSPFYVSGGNGVAIPQWQKAMEEKTVTSTKKDVPF